MRIGILELVYFGYVSTYSNAQIIYRGSHLQRAFLMMLQAAIASLASNVELLPRVCTSMDGARDP